MQFVKKYTGTDLSRIYILQKMGSDLKDQDQMPFFKQWWEKSSSLKTTKIVSKLGYNIKNIATIYILALLLFLCNVATQKFTPITRSFAMSFIEDQIKESKITYVTQRSQKWFQ